MNPNPTNSAKIAIFGGAFNPPHIGHIEVVKHLIEKNIVQKVWIMPDAHHRVKGALSNNNKRLKWCQLSFNDIPNCIVSPLAMDISVEYKNHPDMGSTYFLLKKIQELTQKSFDTFAGNLKTPSPHLYFVVGQDNAEQIHTWHRSEELLSQFSFIVLPRKMLEESSQEPNPQLNPSKGTWYKSDPNIFLEDFSLQNISSTELRKKLNTNLRDLKKWMNEEVFKDWKNSN